MRQARTTGSVPADSGIILDTCWFSHAHEMRTNLENGGRPITVIKAKMFQDSFAISLTGNEGPVEISAARQLRILYDVPRVPKTVPCT